jgi:hypothetical protein
MKQLISPFITALFMATPSMATDFVSTPLILASSHQTDTKSSEGVEDEEDELVGEEEKNRGFQSSVSIDQ